MSPSLRFFLFKGENRRSCNTFEKKIRIMKDGKEKLRFWTWMYIIHSTKSMVLEGFFLSNGLAKASH